MSTQMIWIDIQIETMNDNKKKAINGLIIGHKNIDDFVEKCQIDGKLWHRCLWMGCDYTTNRSNHWLSCIWCHYSQLLSLQIGFNSKTLKETHGYWPSDVIPFGLLIAYLLSQTGVRPYRCSFEGCTYATIQSSALKIHIRRRMN